jgi:hypothetical protein
MIPRKVGEMRKEEERSRADGEEGTFVQKLKQSTIPVWKYRTGRDQIRISSGRYW